MVTFILNDQLVSSAKPGGSSLLDFIRYEKDLPGAKSGCREGDCGACTVLEGTVTNGKVYYKSIVSCLTPLLNAHGKHIVTIEGINMGHLSPVQSSLVDNAAIQCGFCTPGFVMALTSHCMSAEKSSLQKAIASVSGNICRCTGYKSIEKAAYDISRLLKDKTIDDPVGWLVGKKYLPDYFLNINDRLIKIRKNTYHQNDSHKIIAGGTDLMVQNPEILADLKLSFTASKKELKGIKVVKGKCIIGAASTAGEIEHSPVLIKIIPEISSFFKLVASEPVRNMGTIAGNIVNASPIGDLTIIFLALNADINTSNKGEDRAIPLKDFFTGYKKLAIRNDELVKSVSFNVPEKPFYFNFEKVSKRTHLDIASVNSAIHIITENDRVGECFISAGGVSPIPLFLSKTSAFIKGKQINPGILISANEIMQKEISPISDVRGSDTYKRRLLRQLLFAHFIKLFPEKIPETSILQYSDQA